MSVLFGSLAVLSVLLLPSPAVYLVFSSAVISGCNRYVQAEPPLLCSPTAALETFRRSWPRSLNTTTLGHPGIQQTYLTPTRRSLRTCHASLLSAYPTSQCHGSRSVCLLVSSVASSALPSSREAVMLPGAPFLNQQECRALLHQPLHCCVWCGSLLS